MNHIRQYPNGTSDLRTPHACLNLLAVFADETESMQFERARKHIAVSSQVDLMTGQQQRGAVKYMEYNMCKQRNN